jgi:hypothetical protein
VWLAAGKAGLLGMGVPEEFGGGGVADFRYNAVLTEELVAGGASGVGFPLQNETSSRPTCYGWPRRSGSAGGCPARKGTAADGVGARSPRPSSTRACSPLGGTNEIMKEIIGRTLLG